MSTQLADPTYPASEAPSAARETQYASSAEIGKPADTVPLRPGSEYYDRLLWRLWSQQTRDDGVALILGLCGCSRQAGVSTLAANLAIRAADHGLGPVLLVDANLCSPELHKLAPSEVRAGLVDVLAGQASLRSCVQSTPVTGLDLLPLGGGAGSEAVRIDPQQTDALISQMREQYAFVICDLPIASQMGYAKLLAGSLDATLLVVRSACVKRQSAQQLVRDLSLDGVPLAGMVMTDRRAYVPNWLGRLV
jgi:Mrp family chromosome partitioning ATPase